MDFVITWECLFEYLGVFVRACWNEALCEIGLRFWGCWEKFFCMGVKKCLWKVEFCGNLFFMVYAVVYAMVNRKEIRRKI